MKKEYSSVVELLHNYRIVVCGTAKDVEDKIDDFILYTSRAFSDFKEVQFLICESFSTDETLSKLKKIAFNQSNFRYFTDPNASNELLKRTQRIASARSAIQNYVNQNYRDFDFVAMMDLDGVNRDLKVNSVKKAFQYANWDAIFANQPFRYYDIWALRANGWCEGDCWEEFQSLLARLPKKKALEEAVTSKMKSIPENAPPIRVESAFGGLGIYRTSAFLHGEYIGLKSDGEEVCEHVNFHKTLTEKGYKLFIMPCLVNLNRRSQILNLIKELLLRIIRKIN